MSHWLPRRVEAAALGSALEKKGWRWKGQPARCHSLLEATSPAACSSALVRGTAAFPSAPCYSQDRSPGSSGPRVTSRPGSGCSHTDASSSHVREFGPALLPVCSTPAIILGDAEVPVVGPLLPWYQLLVFPAALETLLHPGLLAPW